jgi:chemotaxis regulatin CheY-phosphate phosphatase CheZ
MSTPAPVTPLAIEDYDAIEAAVMETQRGRWFLAEHARRNRNCDTEIVLSSLERIEKTIRRERAAPDIDRIRLDLADMAEAISRTKQEIAQMKLDTEHGGRFADASHELDAIVDQTETATNEILLAAEGIQEAAWTLREAGAADELCEKLDVHATDIYTACSFQDLTGQRTRKVVTVLRYLESRINAMMDIWGLGEAMADIVTDAPPPASAAGFDPMDQRPDAHLLNGPQLHGRGVDQGGVDELMWETSQDEAAIDAIEADAFAFGEDAQADETLPVDADVFAGADVFASDAVDRVAANVFAPTPRGTERSAPMGETALVEEEVFTETTTVAVGNTMMVVETGVVELAAEEAEVALAVVPSVDPVAEFSTAHRLITFG